MDSILCVEGCAMLQVRIGSEHCRAICDEVAERLRIYFDKTETAPSERIQILVREIELMEVAAPSIIPSLQEMSEEAPPSTTPKALPSNIPVTTSSSPRGNERIQEASAAFSTGLTEIGRRRFRLISFGRLRAALSRHNARLKASNSSI